ncbi:MAG TPA: LacI family DNA-binding transcriptional regulator [Candidatus Sulfotelmatobacter sp.]|nr:LacI family DNA-binding transcriptional regulator [Candidatus Sulfotelmatobacter sp.]
MTKVAKPHGAPKAPAVTLKLLASHLDLTAGTVSSVLNNTPASRSIPERTRNRILEAARRLNYRPNFLARSLRVRRSYTVGVIAQEIGDPYGATIISSIETYLRKNNFFFLTVVHRHDYKLMRSYSQLLVTRGVEGIITIDTSIDQQPSLPTVAIAGHQQVPNVSNIILDHRRAAQLVLQHLISLGHRQIAFFRGPSSSSDSAPRWNAIQEVAAELHLPIHPELVFQLERIPNTSDLGYLPAKALLATRLPFSALFAYNDTSAVGAMFVLHEAGFRVPEDISVVGFDDIAVASFTFPPLTTVRQPLLEMGTVAAQTLLDRIEERAPFIPEIALAPDLIIRNSTGPARQR